jgi:excisionase family DNA binding protein
MADKILLNAGQVADSLSISLATVRRWSRDGTLKPVKIGAAARFPIEEVRELVDKLKAERSE